jgi:hypothetical protein
VLAHGRWTSSLPLIGREGVARARRRLVRKPRFNSRSSHRVNAEGGRPPVLLASRASGSLTEGLLGPPVHREGHCAGCHASGLLDSTQPGATDSLGQSGRAETPFDCGRTLPYRPAGGKTRTPGATDSRGSLVRLDHRRRVPWCGAGAAPRRAGRAPRAPNRGSRCELRSGVLAGQRTFGHVSHPSKQSPAIQAGSPLAVHSKTSPSSFSLVPEPALGTSVGSPCPKDSSVQHGELRRAGERCGACGISPV